MKNKPSLWGNCSPVISLCKQPDSRGFNCSKRWPLTCTGASVSADIHRLINLPPDASIAVFIESKLENPIIPSSGLVELQKASAVTSEDDERGTFLTNKLSRKLKSFLRLWEVQTHWSSHQRRLCLRLSHHFHFSLSAYSCRRRSLLRIKTLMSSDAGLMLFLSVNNADCTTVTVSSRP